MNKDWYKRVSNFLLVFFLILFFTGIISLIMYITENDILPKTVDELRKMMSTLIDPSEEEQREQVIQRYISVHFEFRSVLVFSLFLLNLCRIIPIN